MMKHIEIEYNYNLKRKFSNGYEGVFCQEGDIYCVPNRVVNKKDNPPSGFDNSNSGVRINYSYGNEDNFYKKAA